MFVVALLSFMIAGRASSSSLSMRSLLSCCDRRTDVRQKEERERREREKRERERQREDGGSDACKVYRA